MSASYVVYLPLRALPDDAWLASSIRGMEPTFAFAEPYDFATETGWCPCRLSDAGCGFQWELDDAAAVPAELASRRFDGVAALSFGASGADAMCAVLVAANIALIAGGVVQTPEGERIEAEAALPWASERIRTMRGRKKPRAKPKPSSPDALLAVWLAALPGTGVENFVRSLPDDPRVGILFGAGLVLKARHWTVSTPAGVRSTASLPRNLSADQMAGLEASVQQLVALLRSGPVLGARLEPEGFALEVACAGGTLTAHASAQPAMHAAVDALAGAWELFDGTARVYPDLAQNRLVRGT
ncbi:hypothetical protein [Dokdonella koreensis]|uniref:Uncharacterized protein n=1 Tax=Dokdonella koreensis DS-123 TaxID=1300342 RepID=A0A167G7E6_9GAMM|nr:hypothetical protein [Dokdonella koreensis]ANB16228.1 Hypothetical protein I596_189 [Dokdonella koreensis DS-123]